MEKRGYIEDGWTPPENKENKQASVEKPNLESHPTARFIKEATERFNKAIAEDKVVPFKVIKPE